MRYLTFSALVIAAAIGCEPRDGGMAVDTTAARAGIDSTRTEYARLQMAGDAAAVAGLYTEDATLDLYGVPRLRGRAAIQNALQMNYGMGKFTLTEINPIETNVRSNTEATEYGTFHNMRDSSGVVLHEWGRFVVGLNKGAADNRWRLSYLLAFPDSVKTGN